MVNKEIAQALADANILKFGSFTLASGKTSPIYVDLRVLPSYPTSFKIIGEALGEKAKKLNVDMVAGAETAGIPLAAAIALSSGIPMIYVRKRPKQYGTRSHIEGNLKEGAKVLLIDDMATNGLSKINFINGIRAAQGEVSDVLIVLDREQGATDILRNEGKAQLHSLITLRELIGYELDKNLITQDQYNNVISYLDQQ